jgi:hypothetical protein
MFRILGVHKSYFLIQRLGEEISNLSYVLKACKYKLLLTAINDRYNDFVLNGPATRKKTRSWR